jgi:AraC-like DNA-binding protein
LHGSVNNVGVSFEWHDFRACEELDWGRSFHPNTIEICLNSEGNGRIAVDDAEMTFAPLTVGFYRRGEENLSATRQASQQHRFLTIEISFEFLRRYLSECVTWLHPLVRDVILGPSQKSALSSTTRLTGRQQQLLASLRYPPVLAAAQSIWYQAKALELASELFFFAPGQPELFCQRQQRLSAERVEKVIELLREKFVNPPSLEEIGKTAGCSPFYLSRTFSAAMGMTIPQYIRQLRMERAAVLLQSGRFNVTEAAFEVGYLSLSHFSQVFQDAFGCYPAAYPVRAAARKYSLKERR